MLRALLQATGERPGLLGTVTSIVAGVEHPVVRTTPEAPEVQRAFREMLDGGDTACAMEVSSHALELGRVEGVRFAAAIFTNLTHDHLDFHADMEEYFQAKRRLFLAPGATPAGPTPAGAVVEGPGGGISSGRAHAVENPPPVRAINLDDPYGRRLALGCRAR